jgi:predicted ATPase
VFGERFSTRGVAALLGGDPLLDKTAAWFEQLAARELVTEVGAKTRAEDAIYTFRHSLVREAAYATLTEEDRALGHRLAGAWLENSGSASAVILAEHFQRGGEPLRAVRWCRRAAEQALAADDLAAACERVERGVSYGAAGKELGALRLVEAEVHVWREELGRLDAALLEQGRASEALAAASEAYSLLASLGSIEEGESLVRLLYAEALAAAGRASDFAKAITEARDRLLARATKISDPGWRERFLTSVSENARTLSLAPPVATVA